MADTAEGYLEGTFTLDGKTTKLSCRPHKLYCATPEGAETDHPIRRIVVDAASKKRVATFAPGDGFKRSFEVPAEGFPPADCEIAEPASSASP